MSPAAKIAKIASTVEKRDPSQQSAECCSLPTPWWRKRFDGSKDNVAKGAVKVVRWRRAFLSHIEHGKFCDAESTHRDARDPRPPNLGTQTNRKVQSAST